jgi:hypothetical protein
MAKASLIFCLIGMALSSYMPAEASEASRGVFCGRNLAVDYASPFRRMPPVHPPPESGALPFAPKEALLYQVAPSQIRNSGGTFGYAFTGGRSARVTNLGWLITTQLARVNRRGEALRVVQSKQRKVDVIRDLRNLNFGLSLTDGAGLYRYEIEFQRLNGHRLASYSQYVRVLPRHVRPVLRASAAKYRPGELAKLQVVNFGTTPISYGEGTQIYVLDDGVWIPSTAFPSKKVLRRAVVLQAGEAGSCEDLAIPSGTPPGSYRVEKQVPPSVSGATRRVVAEFQVAPS